MAKVAVILANGFEEIEAVAVIDVLRRAQVQVVVAALEGDSAIGSHNIRVAADCSIDELGRSDLDGVVLPGGMPGATTLRDDGRVRALVQELNQAGKLVCAICAAPIALDAAGVIAGRCATSYPGHELQDADYRTERVVEEENLITSRGPGTAIEFALTLVRRLVGHDAAIRIRQAMLVKV